MAPKPKKPGLASTIGVGKPKSDDLGEPDALDKSPEPEQDPPADEPDTGSGDLLGDMTKPLIDAGLSDDDAKTMLADVLKAAVACLERGGKVDEGAPPAAPAAPPEQENPYGR